MIKLNGWFKTTYSNGANSCVEAFGVAEGETVSTVKIRDTKDRDGGTLAFGPVAWQQFAKAVKGGVIA